MISHPLQRRVGSPTYETVRRLLLLLHALNVKSSFKVFTFDSVVNFMVRVGK